MFITKREAWPIGLVLMGAALAMALSLSLAVPKAGAVTIAELLVQIQALQAQLLVLQGQQGTTPATACTFTQSLYLGVSNAQVKCLQQYLNGAGYAVSASGAGSVGNETNYFGAKTQAALAKWQAANAVSPAAGYFGTISRAKYVALAGGGGGVVIPPVGGGLSVTLRADTPATRAIVTGAANMPFARFSFTAGSGAVTVSSLKFTRSGISSDGELGSGYLYDSDTGNYISQYTGLGSGVLSFASTGGLFTVNAGATKNVELRLDVSTSASNNHTMGFGINAATDVTSNASSVSGSFPMVGNQMSFVQVTNPAVATLITSWVATGNSVNAGTTGYLAGSFTLQAQNSAVNLSRIMLTQNGSIISSTDVANIKLVTTGGTQIGSTLANLAADGTGTFVLSPTYQIPSGQTIQVNVFADVISGVDRTLKFNILNLRDIQATDNTYNVGINPLGSVVMTMTSIQAGTLTVTLDPLSPTGNVAKGQTNLTLAKFKVVAYGEQVKVLWVPFSITAATTTGTTVGNVAVNTIVQNICLFDDAGNQIGTTIISPTGNIGLSADGTKLVWDSSNLGAVGSLVGETAQAASFGSSSSYLNYLIPANTTRIWSLKADVQANMSANITSLVGALGTGLNNYQGQVSLQTGSTTGVSASTLSLASNPFTAQLNSGMGTGNLTKGQSPARIGSYTLSASSAEGINVSTISLLASTTFPFANLYIKVNGVQFGTMNGSVTGGLGYTYAGSAPVNITAGGSVTVDVYADVLSTATDVSGNGTAYPYILLTGASAVGATTATTQILKTTAATVVTALAPVNGQSFVMVTTGGTLAIAKDSSTPAAYQAIMGKTAQSLAIWRFTADANSDKLITAIMVRDAVGANQKAMFKNLQFYKGGVAVGPIVTSGTASGTAGYAYPFNFTSPSPVVVPQSGGLSLELRGDVVSFADAGSTGTSNSTHSFAIEQPSEVTALSSGGSLAVAVTTNITITASPTITVARTKLTVTSDPTGISVYPHFASAADDMAVFVFSADPTADVTINTVTLKLAGSTLTTVTVTLIDSDTNAAWGTSAVTAAQLVNARWNKGVVATASSSISFYPNFLLTAGATKRIKVRVDTNAAVPGDTAYIATAGSINGTQAQWYIDNDTTTNGTLGIPQNAACWSDGTTVCTGVSGAFNLETKVLPIYGPALRY